MAKTSKPQERHIGGIDDSYMVDLDPNAPDFLEKYIEAVKRPVTTEKEG
ncbi:hypothetical protein M5X17_10415 [Paenibacillus alvei]|nr:hypothetical protein [Paenibacillus alvei]MCY9734160.1 hypothetical protein [Paenibacillus alvei]